jgi:hypothetical protein
MKNYSRKPDVIILLIFQYAVLMFAVSETVFAQQELPIATIEFPPFNYEEDGNQIGSSTEIIKQIQVT